MPAWALKDTEKLPQIAIFLRNQGRRDLIHLQAAIFFRNIDRHQPQVTGFSEQATRDLQFLRLDRGDLRKDLLFGKFDRGALDLALFIRDIFRR